MNTNNNDNDILGSTFGWNQALQKRKPVATFTHRVVPSTQLLRLWRAKRDVGFVIWFVVRESCLVWGFSVTFVARERAQRDVGL